MVMYPREYTRQVLWDKCGAKWNGWAAGRNVEAISKGLVSKITDLGEGIWEENVDRKEKRASD